MRNRLHSSRLVPNNCSPLCLPWVCLCLLRQRPPSPGQRLPPPFTATITKIFAAETHPHNEHHVRFKHGLLLLQSRWSDEYSTDPTCPLAPTFLGCVWQNYDRSWRQHPTTHSTPVCLWWQYYLFKPQGETSSKTCLEHLMIVGGSVGNCAVPLTDYLETIWYAVLA